MATLTDQSAIDVTQQWRNILEVEVVVSNNMRDVSEGYVVVNGEWKK